MVNQVLLQNNHVPLIAPTPTRCERFWDGALGGGIAAAGTMGVALAVGIILSAIALPAIVGLGSVLTTAVVGFKCTPIMKPSGHLPIEKRCVKLVLLVLGIIAGVVTGAIVLVATGGAPFPAIPIAFLAGFAFAGLFNGVVEAVSIGLDFDELDGPPPEQPLPGGQYLGFVA